MPVSDLSDGSTTVQRLDVLAKATTNREYPYHVSLCNEQDSVEGVTTKTQLKYAHMGPPLKPRSGSGNDYSGTAELTDDQRRQIEVFVQNSLSEIKQLRSAAKAAGTKWDYTDEYVIDPPMSPPSLNYNYWRYSCVGFVLAAYRNAGIELLAEDRPLITLEQIKDHYSEAAAYLDDPALREKMGIGEGESWPVALAGHVVNSMARAASEIHGEDASPFQPLEGDEYFPSRREIVEG